MTNKVAAANDALWALVQAAFPDADVIARNPQDAQPPKAKNPTTGVAFYVAYHDDKTAQTLRTALGAPPIYDLQLKPSVVLVYLGDEDKRRIAAWAAVETLKAALLADRSVGGAVDYASLDAAEDAPADLLPWMAGGLIVPVCLLFSATSQAG